MKSNIKLSLSLFLFLFSASLCYGQEAIKYKVKKGIILKDKKTEVGKLSGTANYDEADLTISDLSDNKLMSITGHKFSVDNPFISAIRWYHVKFEDSSKEFDMEHGGNCGPKCVVKFVLGSNGIEINNAPIAEQDAVMSRLNISSKLEEEKAKAQKDHDTMISALKNNEILRDLEKPVTINKASGSTQANNTRTTYNIIQDNKIIGQVVKSVTTTSTSSSTTYSLYEKIYDSGEFVPCAKVTSTFGGVIKLRTVTDYKLHEIKVSDIQKASKTLAAYLVNNKYI